MSHLETYQFKYLGQTELDEVMSALAKVKWTAPTSEDELTPEMATEATNWYLQYAANPTDADHNQFLSLILVVDALPSWLRDEILKEHSLSFDAWSIPVTGSLEMTMYTVLRLWAQIPSDDHGTLYRQIYGLRLDPPAN